MIRAAKAALAVRDVTTFVPAACHGVDHVQLERDDLHREVKRTLASRIGQTTVFDPAGRIERQTVQRDKAPGALSTRRYRYDAAGQLTQIDDSRKGATDYRYDPVGRLIESIGPGLRERFAFDPASNIVDPGALETARTRGEYLGPQESTLPASVPKVLGNLLKEYAGTHFDYDAQGNLVQKRSPAGVQRFEWDAFNRMRTADVEETSRRSASRYFYDALGRRIGKEVNGSRTVFGWDGDALAYESNDSRSTHYVYEAATFVPMAQYVSEPVEGIETPVVRADARYVPEEDPLQRVPVAQSEARVMFYHCDQIGTPLMMTDEAGEVVWEAAYKAWGEAREVIGRASGAAGVGLVQNSLRFQGQQVDDETGLHYNRYRYYDPNSSRFLSKDPIGLAGGINAYQYVPNPVEWVDTLGLWGSSPLTKYRYNSNGTLKSAAAKIRPEDLGTGTSTNASSRVAARAFGCASDDAGHPIGRNLGGLGGVKEVFPQDPNTNRGSFRDFEGDIAQHVRNGSNVIVRVVPQYASESTRPDSILYQARVDGVTHSRIFKNPCPCSC